MSLPFNFSQPKKKNKRIKTYEHIKIKGTYFLIKYCEIQTVKNAAKIDKMINGL